MTDNPMKAFRALYESLGTRMSDGQAHDRQPLPDEIRGAVLARDRWTCQDCYHDLSDHAYLQIDHLIPIAGGGGDETTNLRTLCQPCNEAKSNYRTFAVIAQRPRLIVDKCHYCTGDLDQGRNRVFCASCRGLRTVTDEWQTRHELSTVVARRETVRQDL